MEMKAQQRIAAGRQQVWEALNDPEILRAAIPGCESFESDGENRYNARITNRIGPVKASFRFAIELSELDPPNSYVIQGKGQGGAAGFANGGARVSLEDDGGDTLLNYELDASVGGKLAQLGGRLIDGAAKKLADQFFTRLGEAIANMEPPPEEPGAAETKNGTESGPESGSGTGKLVRLGVVLLIAALIVVWLI